MVFLVCMALLLVADSVASEFATELSKLKRTTQELALAMKPFSHPVAFMATLSQDQNNLRLHQTIVYDRVITNIGNAYNAKTGRFHAPITGIYVFNFNVMAGDSDYVEAKLTVNNKPIVNALSDHESSSTSWDMGTTNAIIHLFAVDFVNVAIQWPEGKNSLHGNSFNTFSGYLLRTITWDGGNAQ